MSARLTGFISAIRPGYNEGEVKVNVQMDEPPGTWTVLVLAPGAAAEFSVKDRVTITIEGDGE